jgi:hypothetical protein
VATANAALPSTWLNGKIADIAHANSIEPIVIFDLTRTQADTVMDHVYALIDSFKNGRIFSPKSRENCQDL